MRTSTNPRRKSKERTDSFWTHGSSGSESDAGAKSITVALTGSTGNFGAYLLDCLLRTPNVTKIYCLNRSADANERQERADGARGLKTCFDEERVEFLEVDFSAEKWGMKNDVLETFVGEIDVVIHNAWPVDFNRNFVSFQSHVDGVRHLIDMAHQSHKSCPSTLAPKGPMQIIFISSIGTVSNWASQAPTSRSLVPETELMDWRLARTGYGQSKLLSERMLAHAARQYGIPVTIARVGQMAGPVLRGEHGTWPEKEWLPSLIKSSVFLRAVPETLGPMDRVDWIPVDVAAQVLVELLMYQQGGAHGTVEDRRQKKRKEDGARFFHIVNPRAVQWSDVLTTVRKHLPNNIEPVRIEDWIDLLQRSAENKDTSIDEGTNPAAKLMDTFDHIRDRSVRFPKARAAVLDTKKTVKASPTLAKVPPVGQQWIELWMKQWGYK